MKVARERAERLASKTLRSFGITARDADLAGNVLVSADVRGKHSHGLSRLPRVVTGIEHGNIDPHGEITVVHDGGPTATIDGGSRIGPVVATEAMNEAIERADEYGIGAVGVSNGNHLGMLGYYTGLALQDGFVGVGLTNTEPAMPPAGGVEPILGTNPIAVGIPTDPPFNLDMSTAARSRGEIAELQRAGGVLPEGVALSSNGTPTTDPTEALEGVILPFGDHKGAGLAIAIELLAGGLVGAAMGNDVTGTYHTEDECTKGDLFLAVDTGAFVGNGFIERANAFVRELRASAPAEDVEEVRLPGEKSIEADRSADEVTIDRDVWDEVAALGDGAPG